MDICFLRHGAYRKLPGMSDTECRLTDEGAAEMGREAAAMKRLGLRVDAVLTSPLARARQTAEIVARAIGPGVTVDRRLAPGFEAEALRGIIRDHPGAAALLLVGHEPDFSSTIAACTGGVRVSCGKGTLARVTLDRPVSLQGVLTWLMPAETLQA